MSARDNSNEIRICLSFLLKYMLEQKVATSLRSRRKNKAQGQANKASGTPGKRRKNQARFNGRQSDAAFRDFSCDFVDRSPGTDDSIHESTRKEALQSSEKHLTRTTRPALLPPNARQ